MLSECIYKVLMASGVVTSSDACDLSGAIEAAVLEAQAKQEPVAWMYEDVTANGSATGVYLIADEAFRTDPDVFPVFRRAAPVVQPDMVMIAAAEGKG